MFGNPNISATPVDDLFSSQADTYNNSFSNPINPANMNPGWGIDPSLLSPSYTSQYRPHYGGPNGAAHNGRPGFFSGVNNLMPWASVPNWGNPTDNVQSSINSVSSRPVDGFMWGAQRVAMPYLAYRAAGPLLGGYNWAGMGRFSYAAGRSFGRGLGTGIARGAGFGSSSLMTRGVTSIMGGTFGAAAGWMGPMMLAQGLMTAGEKGIFNPYINTRRSAQNLQDNFAGITFADSIGSSITGGGLGGYESSQIARQITGAGIRDINLSTGQYGAAADFIGRSGLTDNVNSRQISKRIKDSVDQMKLIMSIANMPEMKDAIEQLAKLQRMGANVSGGVYSDASGVMRQLGGMASIAGTNVQRLMNTAGAQGQYLYQANGMTPYLGQLAAANSYAALSSGNRMGLISSSQLARLGGLEGATQATLTGELNASQTLYSKISNYNRYMGAGNTGSVISNLSRFGQSMSRDPMGTYGSTMLFGNIMGGNRLSERGSLALDDQIFEILRNIPGMVDLKTGKIDFEKAVPYLTEMGMSNEQIMAYASKRVSETNSGVLNQSMKALDRNLIEQQQQLVDRETLYGGAIGRNYHRLQKFGRNLTAQVGDITGGAIASIEGGLKDSIGAGWNNLVFGDSIKSSGATVEDALAGRTGSGAYVSGFDLRSRRSEQFSKQRGQFFGDHSNYKFYGVTKVASELNAAKNHGDPNAIAYFKATTATERQKALNKFKESKGFSHDSTEFLDDPNNYKNLDKELASISRYSSRQDEEGLTVSSVFNTLYDNTIGAIVGKPEVKAENGADILAKVGGLKGADLAENARVAGRAVLAATSVYGDSELSTSNIEDLLKTDTNLQAISKATGIKDPQDLLAYIRKTAKSAADNKVIGLTTNSLKVKGKGVDALKAAGERNGGLFFDQNAIETKHLNFKESMEATMALQKDNQMRGDLLEKYRSGHLDFASFQNSVNALDNKKAVKDFSDAVKVFSDAVKSDAGNRSDDKTVGQKVKNFFWTGWGDTQKVMK